MANESTNATELANTIRLNGWQRLGIILSVVWMFAVSGYAAYEFTTFPLKPFVSYVGDAGNGYEDDAEPFVFVRIVRRSGPDALSYKERAFFDEQIRNAKTSADRDLLVSALNVPESSSNLKPLFYLALVVPVLLGWLTTYVLVVAFRWVTKGFSVK